MVNTNVEERKDNNHWKVKALADGRINVKPLITHRFTLDEVNTAFEMMKNRTEFFNKVMLVMNEER